MSIFYYYLVRLVGVHFLYRLSMNLLFALKEYNILLSGTATIQYMDRCCPWRQDRGQPVFGMYLWGA